jgi:predicted RNase H-like nuclease (RuvC/YqgF family)
VTPGMSEHEKDSKELTVREYMLQAMARNEAKVEALTNSMRDLKSAVEELIDRVDADIDTLRSRTEAISAINVACTDNTRRITTLETTVKTLESRVVYAGGFGAGAGAALALIMRLIWK